MKKIFTLSAASILCAAPVMAADFSVTRGEAFAIRSCPIEGDMSRGVCYNQETEWEVLGLRVPFSGSRERVIEIDCDRRVVRPIGKEFCPVRAELAPATFL
tara:strand:+ start:245 stop:547 length:303 start_codon:yes stop_codon:yes gene_type:complete